MVEHTSPVEDKGFSSGDVTVIFSSETQTIRFP